LLIPNEERKAKKLRLKDYQDESSQMKQELRRIDGQRIAPMTEQLLKLKL